MTPAFLNSELNGQKTEVCLAEVCRVGRSFGNDLILDDSTVSRNHALVYIAEIGSYSVNDLGSSNGTFVNGVRVSSPTLLKDGDEILFGSCPVKFHQQQVQARSSAAPVSSDATSMLIIHRQITTLVVDIRGFTVLAQRIDADTTATVAGTLFREAGGVLKQHGAWGQKYLGDAVMAVWLHSMAVRDDMVNVVAALAQISYIAEGLQKRFRLDAPIRIGAGINSGLAMLGNVGSSSVPDHTALGDSVNRAFRLESATKDVGVDVLMGEESFKFLPLEELKKVFHKTPVNLKGYAEPVVAWGAKFEDYLPVIKSLNITPRGGA